MSTTTWTYGASITRERGDFVVSVRDLPEVVTSGSTQEEALELAADAIEVIVEGPYQFSARPLPNRTSAQSLIMPNPRGALALQQLTSSLPGRF